MKSPRTELLVRWAVFPSVCITIALACSTSKSAVLRAQVLDNQPPKQSSTPSTPSDVHDATPCTLKMSEAPVISGFRLGMTVTDILALFAGTNAETELRSTLTEGRFGNSSFQFTPKTYGSNPDFKDVSRLVFSLLDGYVSNFTISYTGPKWPHVDKFIENFAEHKNIPPASEWEPYAGLDDQMKTLSCDGFSIRIFEGGEGGNLNYVLLQDLEAEKKLRDRRKKAREQATPTPAQVKP